MAHYKVVATVANLKGECPNGNKVGDGIERARGNVTGVKCPTAFNSIYPIVSAMRFGAELPWLEDREVAVAQCPDPEYCVTFEIRREKEERLQRWCEEFALLEGSLWELGKKIMLLKDSFSCFSICF